MKTIKTLILPLIALVMVLLSSCATSKRAPERFFVKEMNGISFQKMDISSIFTVEFTKADEYKVEVILSEKLKPYLILEIQDGRLVIGMTETRKGLKQVHKEDAVVKISAPTFSEVVLSGAVTLFLEGDWQLDRASFCLSGASNLIGGNIEAENLSIVQSGASSFNSPVSAEHLYVDQSGAASLYLGAANPKVGTTLTVDASGASVLYLEKVPFEQVKLDASGASKVFVYPVKQIVASVSGCSSIKYVDSSGILQKDFDQSGMASVRKL